MVQFQSARKPTGGFSSAIAIAELVYHSIVRSVRKQHNNAFLALAVNMLQVAIFVGVFYIMFTILGLRGAAIRGDFLVCIMTRIFLFMTHTKTPTAVIAPEGPATAIMQHATIYTIISIMAAALGAL